MTTPEIEVVKKSKKPTVGYIKINEIGENPVVLTKFIANLSGMSIAEVKKEMANGCIFFQNQKLADLKTIKKNLQALCTDMDVEIVEGEIAVKKPELTDTSGYITLNDYFKVEKATYQILLANVMAKRSTMLLGPTGVGKTELIKNIADTLKLPLTIFDMGTMSDPIMSLVGTHTISVKDDKTVSEFIPSRFSEVIQKPGIILLDEISRAVVTANNLLFPCLDFRRELPMEYCFHNCEPVKVHPDCVFIATANLGSQYTGTHKLDRALLDRFVLIEVDPLTTEMTTEVIQHYAKSIKTSDIAVIVDIYNKINKSHDEFRVNFNLSIRHLKNIADLVKDGFTIYDSFYAICKGLGSKEGLKAIEDILNMSKK